jgi:hypothetical protein
MGRIFFGNEVAENDDLLTACPIHQLSHQTQKPIITGRWGSGKTASLLLGNTRLSETLKGIDERSERLWYVNEGALDTTAITRLFVSEDKKNFTQSLEKLWDTEILRRAVLILGHLAATSELGSGIHWKFVHNAIKAPNLRESIWTQLPAAIKIIAGLDSGQTEALDDLKGHFEDLFSRKARDYVQQCLKELPPEAPRPVIGTEPIDTPTSVLEEQAGLAQAVITALLNLYVANYQPSSRQLLEVWLAIPWHRYSSEQVNFPQKLIQYKAYLQWAPSELRAFIDRRILWEFRRVGRHYSAKGSQDEWLTLFGVFVESCG